MSTFTIVMIVILVILIGGARRSLHFRKEGREKQAEQQEQMARRHKLSACSSSIKRN